MGVEDGGLAAGSLTGVIDKAREALWALEEAVSVGDWERAEATASSIAQGMKVLQEAFRAVADYVEGMDWGALLQVPLDDSGQG